MTGLTLVVKMSCFFVSAMMLYYGLSDLVDDLFSRLGKGGMENLHLFGEVGFQPLVFLDDVLDELDGLLAVDLDSPFAFLSAIEPGLRPPYDAVLVGIDTDRALDVETLDVEVEIGKRVDDALALYGVVKSFFLSSSLIVERKTPCMRAR